jgi:hypothetical protein
MQYIIFAQALYPQDPNWRPSPRRLLILTSLFLFQ